MIIYRPHRGNLADSMAEAKEFNNIEEMKEYIVKQWNNQFSINDIVLDNKTTNDDRIGWNNVRDICIKRLGKEDYIKKYKCPQYIGAFATDYIKL